MTDVLCALISESDEMSIVLKLSEHPGRLAIGLDAVIGLVGLNSR